MTAKRKNPSRRPRPKRPTRAGKKKLHEGEVVNENPLSCIAQDRSVSIHQEIGFAEAEARLRELCSALKESSIYDSLKERRIGEFWEPGWPEAPFEKELTFRQIASLDVVNILKKHSFHGGKVRAFISAMERALRGETKADPGSSAVPSNASTLREAWGVARQKLEALLQNECRGLCCLWRSMLSGPGASEKFLFAPRVGNDEVKAAELNDIEFGRTLLRALGAVPVQVNSIFIKEAWTLNEGAAALVYGALVATMQSKEDVRAEETIKAFFPFIDPRTIEELIEKSGMSPK